MLRKLAAVAGLIALAGCAQPIREQPPPPAPVPQARPSQPPARRIAPAKPALPTPRPVAPTPVETSPPVVEPERVPEPSPAPPSKRSHVDLLPPGAREYGPLLVQKQGEAWPDVPMPWTIAGLIEQESCASLKSKQCWNPRAELKTYREYGVGLGQITVAYNSDGSERFNEFKELQRKYAELSSWRWEDRYDPIYQLTAVIDMTRALWRKVPPAATDDDRWAFTDASYNGGIGSLLQDRRMCANSADCDQTRWFGNIETHSLKSKAPQKTYGGQSWFSINRGHVRSVLTIRRAKYRLLWQGTT